jgi:hypothetical protein
MESSTIRQQRYVHEILFGAGISLTESEVSDVLLAMRDYDLVLIPGEKLRRDAEDLEMLQGWG